ncbi:MAG: hypothetical protein R3C01_02000 [Planctomycetaceae bacterium]
MSLPLPMWGWLWIVNGFVSPSMIQELLTDIEIASDEDARFVAAGWKGVGTTGMLAIEFDGELLLGIHGAGYDFYAAHWEPLYDALDL